VTYSMTAGWAAVIVGNLKIVTAMSTAERYKGAFIRTLKQAKELYASILEENLGSDAAQNLLDVITKYESLVSTSPTVYEAATAELEAAIALASGLAAVDSIQADTLSTSFFNLQGIPVDPSRLIQGQPYIHNGKKIIKK
ncbi:MAG: hypothetical protein K2K32_04765, partial [Muribaculaceae bacterium]|nr:hypothetical protein [Muribaculaceae bacterium]